MRETEQKLKAYFQETGKNQDECTKMTMQKTILLAEAELKETQKKKSAGFGALLLGQIRSMGAWMWLAQIGIVLAVYLCIYFMTGMNYQYITARKAAFSAGMCGILLFFSTIPFLYRMKRHRMLEIEATAKYSMGEMILAKMLIIGAEDFLLLFGMIWRISEVSPLTVLQTVFCLCVPFLFALNGGLHVLRKVTFANFHRWAYGLCGVLCVGFLTAAIGWPEHYEIKAEFAEISLFVLVCGVVYQCIAMLRENVQAVYE